MPLCPKFALFLFVDGLARNALNLAITFQSLTFFFGHHNTTTILTLIEKSKIKGN